MAPKHIVELIKARAVPDDRPSEEGVLLDGTLSLPFTLEREWSGAAGYYLEEYFIRVGEKQVYSSAPRQIFVRGLQSRTSVQDRIDERIPLQPGICQVVFVIDGVPMDAAELPVRTLSAV